MYYIYIYIPRKSLLGSVSHMHRISLSHWPRSIRPPRSARSSGVHGAWWACPQWFAGPELHNKQVFMSCLYIIYIYVNICAIHMYIIHTYIYKDTIHTYIYILTHICYVYVNTQSSSIFTITIHIDLMNHVPTAWYMYLSQSCISPFTNISRVTFAKSKHNPVQWIQTQKYMTQCTCVYLCVYIDI